MRGVRGRRGLLITAFVVAAALIAVVVVLRGLGGGCGDGYPQTPECVAEAFVTRDDASKCDLVEPTALEEVMRVRGPAARAGCAEYVESRQPPDELRILESESVQGAGGEPEARVEFVADGEEGALTLRRRDGRWRIVSFAE